VATDNRTGPVQADEAEPALDPVREAVSEAEQTEGLGKPGPALDRRSPFFIGMMGAAGVAVTFAVAELTIRARSILILVGVALFVAAGLDPAVQWLTKRRVPRPAAVLVVTAGVLAIVAGFLAAAVPPLAAQAAALVHQMPHYMHELQDHNSELGKLNAKFHIQQRISSLLSSRGSALIGGVLGAGELVISTASAIVLVLVLSVYFLASLPRTKLFAYRLIPHSRRPRVILIVEEILSKVGAYMLGNVLTSLIAGFGTFFWMLAWGIPYPVLLASTVALLDMIPVIGSTVGGIIVTLVALTVSLPVAIGTLVFYIVYRLAEDYLIVPRVIGRTVRVPALVSMIAVLIGGVLLGIIGALVAIPVAASIRLLLHEVTFRSLDQS
jgi:predicted PurR-regulated permease PerM